jgi:hypothetical protein
MDDRFRVRMEASETRSGVTARGGASTDDRDAGSSRGRARGALALIVLASIVLFLGGFAVWAARQVLNTDDWVETSSELLEDEEIQVALQTFLVDTLFDAVDVEATLSEQLPPPAQPLAGPAAGGLRELANRIAERALDSPKIQQLWADANRAAHEQLLVVVEGGDGSTEVTLDLAGLVEQVGARVGIDVAGKIPEDVGQIEVIKPDEIEAAQDAADLLEKLAYGLVLVSLAIYAIAIWLARGRRRETVRAIGFGWIIVGIAILAVRELAGNALVEQLSSTAGVEPAVNSAWTIGTSLLAASAAALIGYGIVAVIGAYLAGPRPMATGIRRELAPLFRSLPAAYGALLVVVLLVFLWAPTEGTQRLAPSLVLLVLMIVGFEALRRKTVSDYPNETWETFSSRWRSRFSSAGAHVRGREPDPDDERIRQLERLQDLQRSGVLSPEELEAEKSRILNE